MDYTTQSQIVNSQYMAAIALFANEKASLQVIQKYRPENDSTVINTKARISGAEARIKELESQLDNLARYGGASVSLNANLTTEREELSKLEEQYDKIKIDVNQNLTHKFMVNQAVKSEKKAYPVRWLIVATTMIITLLLSLIVILSIEKYRELKYKI